RQSMSSARDGALLEGESRRGNSGDLEKAALDHFDFSMFDLNERSKSALTALSRFTSSLMLPIALRTLEAFFSRDCTQERMWPSPICTGISTFHTPSSTSFTVTVSGPLTTNPVGNSECFKPLSNFTS